MKYSTLFKKWKSAIKEYGEGWDLTEKAFKEWISENINNIGDRW